MEALGRRNFFHALCAAEDYQVDLLLAAEAMLAGWWHARYFRGYARPYYRGGLLLHFQSGVFEGSLFCRSPRKRVRRGNAL